MKKMMEEASVFLYPCIIEYSLICAGILYIMWTFVDQSCRATPDARLNGVRKPYAVDCDQAAKGLFVGIIIVVATVVSLILYFLFLDKPEYTGLAVFQAQMTEIVLYIIGLLAVLYSFVQMTKNLQRAPNYSVGTILDDTLLKISMVKQGRTLEMFRWYHDLQLPISECPFVPAQLPSPHTNTERRNAFHSAEYFGQKFA